MPAGGAIPGGAMPGGGMPGGAAPVSGCSLSTASSVGTAAVSKSASTSSVAVGSSWGTAGDMSCCAMMASARTAAVRAGSAGAWSSCRMGWSAPSAMSAMRKSAEHAREPRTAAAAAWVSKLAEERSEMSGRCHPARRKARASDWSTPRLATHWTACSCTLLSAWRSSSDMRLSAPASRSASRLGSDRASEATACAAWGTAFGSSAASSVMSGWIVMRSMLVYRSSAAKAATTRSIETRDASSSAAGPACRMAQRDRMRRRPGPPSPTPPSDGAVRSQSGGHLLPAHVGG